MKDSLVEFPLCKKIDTSLFSKDKKIIEFIAHSHNILLDTDDDGLEFPEMEQQGIDLTPVEFTDVGFYIFYYITSNILNFAFSAGYFIRFTPSKTNLLVPANIICFFEYIDL
nr:Imm42 family immunity protein [Photorhabdus luminescens]